MHIGTGPTTTTATVQVAYGLLVHSQCVGISLLAQIAPLRCALSERPM